VVRGASALCRFTALQDNPLTGTLAPLGAVNTKSPGQYIDPIRLASGRAWWFWFIPVFVLLTGIPLLLWLLARRRDSFILEPRPDIDRGEVHPRIRRD
jgi:hypothetical protein